MTLGSFLGLLGVAIVLALIPGPDTFLSLRYALRERRLALWSATGTTTALFIWAALAALGLVSLLRASALAYELLTAVGGGYLVYLGVRALRGALAARSKPATAGATVDLSVTAFAGAPVAAPVGASVATAVAASDEESVVASTGAHAGVPVAAPVAASAGASAARSRRIESRGPFFAGVGTSLTNPKTGLFFVSLFPQFVPSGASPLFVVLVLGGTIAGVVYVYLIALAFTADAAGRWLTGPRATLGIEFASAAIFMGLGVYVLTEAGLTTAARLAL